MEISNKAKILADELRKELNLDECVVIAYPLKHKTAIKVATKQAEASINRARKKLENLGKLLHPTKSMSDEYHNKKIDSADFILRKWERIYEALMDIDVYGGDGQLVLFENEKPTVSKELEAAALRMKKRIEESEGSQCQQEA